MSETISIPSGDGTLHAVYDRIGHGPLLILCHGYGTSSEHPAIRGIGERVHAAGWSTARFDFSGHGRSAGPWGLSLERQVRDVGSVLTYFSPNHSALILVGGSLGALSTVIAAQEFPAVRGLVTLNGLFEPELLGWRFHLYQLHPRVRRYARSNLRFYRERFHPERLRIPVLLLHAERDRRVAHAQSERFRQRVASEVAMETIPGADHAFSRGGSMNAVADRTAAWLTRTFGVAGPMRKG